MLAHAPATPETRDALAPFVGQWVRCRGLAAHSQRWNGQVRTLVRALLVDDPERGWVRAADHVWVWGATGAGLCRFGEAVAVEFEGLVRAYESPTRGGAGVILRYGFSRTRGVTPLAEGPAEDPVAAAVALLTRAFGWERVADAVAALHGEG